MDVKYKVSYIKSIKELNKCVKLVMRGRFISKSQSENACGNVSTVSIQTFFLFKKEKVKRNWQRAQTNPLIMKKERFTKNSKISVLKKKSE